MYLSVCLSVCEGTVKHLYMYHRLQVCCARMADFRRKFTDAARRYIQLSYEPAIHTDERLQSLKHAMICAILSQAGGCDNVTCSCDHVTYWCDHVTYWCDHVTCWCDHVTYWCDHVTCWCDHVTCWCDHVTYWCDHVTCWCDHG